MPTPTVQAPASQTPAPPSGGVNTQGQSISTGGGSIVPQALLVSSGPARTATANNVTKLAQITAPPPATTAAAGGSTTSPDMKNMPTININTNSSTPAVPIKTADANAQSSQVATVTAPSGVNPTDTTTSTATGDDYDKAIASAGIKDPGMAAQYKQGLQALDTSAQNAYGTIQSLQTATADNDPATQGLISSIKAKYDAQIQLMKARNTQLLGKANTSVAAFGGLGPMSQDFLSNEQNDADARVSSLQSQEDSLINQAKAAFATKNAKALNDAMTAYDKVNADKLKALNDLLSASDKQVKNLQAQQKIDAAASKQQVTTDISKSTNLGASIYKNIQDSGLTDQAQIDKYIAGIAQEYGISNPDILASAVEKARQTASKTDASVANTADSIANRDARTKLAQQKKTSPSTKGDGVDATYHYTANDVETYGAFLNKGGTGPDGTKYAGRGSDTYVDPNAYTAAMNDWTTHGGTPAGFAKKFPVKSNVNPLSYGQLPEALRPKTSAPASPYTVK